MSAPTAADREVASHLAAFPADRLNLVRRPWRPRTGGVIDVYAGLTYDEYHRLVAVHEAGHAVITAVTGGKVGRVVVHRPVRAGWSLGRVLRRRPFRVEFTAPAAPAAPVADPDSPGVAGYALVWSATTPATRMAVLWAGSCAERRWLAALGRLTVDVEVDVRLSGRSDLHKIRR